jgi:hypothetical protein
VSFMTKEQRDKLESLLSHTETYLRNAESSFGKAIAESEEPKLHEHALLREIVTVLSKMSDFQKIVFDILDKE